MTDKLTFPRGSLQGSYPEYKPTTDLEKVDELELVNGSYEFHLVGVWRDKEGRLWWGTDSGCSCPVPWENHEELDRLFNFDPIAEVIAGAQKPGSYGPGPNPNEVTLFEANIKEALSKIP